MVSQAGLQKAGFKKNWASVFLAFIVFFKTGFLGFFWLF